MMYDVGRWVRAWRVGAWDDVHFSELFCHYFSFCVDSFVLDVRARIEI
jgi:hypothetical protein